MSTPTLKQILDNALRHHQHGNHAQAEAGYRQVLAERADHADTLHLLGLLLHQTRRHDEALGLIQKADSIRPDTADYQNSLAAVYKALGQTQLSIAAGQRAVGLKPDFPEAWYNLGTALSLNNQFEAAVQAHRRALAIRPGYILALMACGGALLELDRTNEAIEAWSTVLTYRPNSAEAHFNLGNAFRVQQHNDKAVEMYRKALALRADYPEANNNLAVLLQQMGKMDEALPLLLHAREDHPEKARVHANLGNILAQDNQWDAAIESYERALVVEEDYYDARFNRALALLMQGKFETGWAEYEWRWLCKSFPSPPRYTEKPRWNGEPLGNKRLLIHAEQGLGDTMQFARYVPMVAQRGGQVIFQVQTPLDRLLKNTPGVQVVAKDLTADQFEVQIPLWSLPLIFGTRLETIPAVNAAFWFDEKRSSEWRTRLDSIRSAEHRLNVGLTWSGSHKFIHNNIRSTNLARFAPLAEVAGINFISLQKGPAAAQASAPPEGMRLIDWTNELDDFADTAALVNQLDLVVTTDTGVAHLAASMGKPTWILLMFSPDFRWLMEREDSPWYPSARLFRQPKTGDWGTPIEQIAEQLAAWPIMA